MYKLSEGVFFVKGAHRGAIYDTNTGNVYSINGVACQTLLGEVENPNFLENLRSQNILGSESAKELDYEDLQAIKQVFDLQFIWFEILSDDCNERCVHCYAESMPPTYRKELQIPLAQSEVPKPENSRRKLSAQEWRNLIDEGAKLGCRQGQFIGGEPLLWRGENGEDALDLAEYARSRGYDLIEIFTNATLLTEKKIRRIKDLGLKVAVSLYSIRPKVHELITQTPGSLTKTLRALELLKQYGVTTRVETVLMKVNEHTLEETEEWIQESGFNHRRPDPIRPKGRGDNPRLFPSKENAVQYGYKLGPNFRADLGTLSRYFSGHSCMAGKITITDEGDVLPCIFSRNMVTGNVVEAGSLSGVIFGAALQRVWNTTKDNVLVCQDCEYRYVCFDCRPLSQGVANGRGDYLTAPYPRCTYNPYTGEWGGGAWRLDENGKPYYDRELKPTIERVLAENPNPAGPQEEGH